VCPSASSKSTCSEQTKSICRCTNLFYQNPDFEKVVFDFFNIPGPPLINRLFEKHEGVQMRKKGEKIFKQKSVVAKLNEKLRGENCRVHHFCAFNDISSIYGYLCTCSKICLKLPVLHN